MSIECRPESGITVRLIDLMLFIGRVLAPRIKSIEETRMGLRGDAAVRAALEDLCTDQDIKTILGAIRRWDEIIRQPYPEWPGACSKCGVDHDQFNDCNDWPAI